jgi:predicted metal-dependent phosphoesterase TrpH
MIDLHMHSSYSEDGEFSPADLVRKCAAAGIDIMSITDHNCVPAYAEALPVAQSMGIRLIPGIEIDCIFEDLNFHVLGYGIDPSYAGYASLEDDIRKSSLAISLKRLAKTQSLGFHVTEDDLRAMSDNIYWNESWPGEMFAEVLLRKYGNCNHPLLLPYLPGGKRSDNPYLNFYLDFYARDKRCYVPAKYPSMQKVIGIIHDSHGTAVLAHPGVNLRGAEQLLPEIIKQGIDGIEAYSSYHTASQVDFYRREARKNGLFITCGTDFHGKTKPAVHLGMQLPCDVSVDCLERRQNQ